MNEWKELGGEEKERGGFAPPNSWRKLRKRGAGGGGGEREAGRVWNYMCQRKSNNTIALSSVVVVVGCCWCAIALATTYLHSFVVVGKLGCSPPPPPPPPPQIPYQYFFFPSLPLSLSHSFSTPFHPLSVAVELHTSFDLVPWKQKEDQTEREKEIVVVVVVVVVVVFVVGGFCQEDFQVS